MILGFDDFLSRGMTASVRIVGPNTLVSKIARRVSRDGHFSVGPSGQIPALLMKTSRRPKSASSFWAAAVMVESFVASSSSRLKDPWTFFSSSSLRTFSPFERLRAPITTWLFGDALAR